MPRCKECQKDFTVAPEDKRILESLGLPEPKLCAIHAHRRRLSFRNERFLYNRTCEMCHKAILAMYSPNSYARVFCRECWFSDQWEALEYGQDYNPGKSFFEQWFELAKKVPYFNLYHLGSNENCEYTNYCYNSKDSYLSFSNIQSEGILYSRNIDDSRECVDCINITNSELLYRCVQVTRCYQSAYLDHSELSSECILGRNLFDCHNCFGSVNLKHKRWYWYNEPLTETEYRTRLAEAVRNRASFEEHKRRFATHAKKYPLEYAIQKSSENITGNLIFNSKDIRNSFFIADGENLGDCLRIILGYKDCYRVSYGGKGEKNYECFGTGTNVSFSFCSAIIPDSTSVGYSFSCYNSNDLFGCMGLRNKKFCILNKQYSEKEYHTLRTKIMDDMRARGDLGEFFPVSLSPHGYNLSMSQEYFPVTEQEAKESGWGWETLETGTRGKPTFPASDIPETISDTSDVLMKEIFSCVRCGFNYRLLGRELHLLRTLGLAAPLICHQCRLKENFTLVGGVVLYPRSCDCRKKHDFHTGGACATNFSTIYPATRPEKVFCSPCYQEVLE